MKKSIFFVSIALFAAFNCWAQSPEKMSYQAIVRDTSYQLVSNQSIGMRISILQGTSSGSEVYAETQFPTTNVNGLVTVKIGEGSVLTGDFSTISWGTDQFFLKTETDPEGGTNFSIVGISQLLSVPYALHAKTAENVTGAISETDPVFEAWDKSSDISISETQINDLKDYLTEEIDGDPSNELQFLSRGNDTLFLTNGGFVKIPGGFSGDYNDLVNLPSLPTRVSDLNNDLNFITGEGDGDSTNELQVLSLSNDTLFLTDGGFVKLEIGFSGDYNDLENLPDIPVNLSDLTNDSGFLTSFTEKDSSVSNEIQDLSLSEDTLRITNNVLGTGIDLSIYKDNTDEQTLEDVLIENNSAGGNNITNLADPVNDQDAVTKSFVTLEVSETGDTLFFGPGQWVIIPGISASNSFVDDIHGNTYGVVTIGTQKWMKENLRVTQYNDGAIIPEIVDDNVWNGLRSPGMTWMEHDSATYANPFGGIYNWYTVDSSSNGGKNVCPMGWHVPSDDEWTMLTDFVGGASVAGGKLKETGLVNWETPNLGATDEFGFQALPAGSRGAFGLFQNLGFRSRWWSTTTSNNTTSLGAPASWTRVFRYDSAESFRGIFERYGGCSIRCLKD